MTELINTINSNDVKGLANFKKSDIYVATNWKNPHISWNTLSDEMRVEIDYIIERTQDRRQEKGD